MNSLLYTATLYEKFAESLTLLLVDAFNCIRNFSPESLMAFLSMIPNPNIDTTHWFKYNPTSHIKKYRNTNTSQRS